MRSYIPPEPIQRAVIAWRRYFLLRWVLVNMLGWPLGLYAGVVVGRILSGLMSNTLVFGLIGMVIVGVVAGGVVGAIQWIALRNDTPFIRQRWLTMSGIGGGCALIPAVMVVFTLAISPGFGYFVIGALYGGIFAGVQWWALRDDFYDREGALALWIVANVFAGGLCGTLSMNTALWLPVFCSLGPVTFGLITGIVLARLLRENDSLP